MDEFYQFFKSTRDRNHNLHKLSSILIQNDFTAVCVCVCAVIIVDMKAREMFTITPEALFIKTVPHRNRCSADVPSMKILCIIARILHLGGRNLMKLVFILLCDLCK